MDELTYFGCTNNSVGKTTLTQIAMQEVKYTIEEVPSHRELISFDSDKFIDPEYNSRRERRKRERELKK